MHSIADSATHNGPLSSALAATFRGKLCDVILRDRAATATEAEHGLQELEGKWKAYPSVSQVWWRNWARITPFFNYPPDIRRAIYTTNSVESLNRSLRKIIKTRGGFPNEEASLKLLFLALRQAAKKWTMPIHHWREALNHFTILWPQRMPALERITQ
jgi:putative transposase